MVLVLFTLFLTLSVHGAAARRHALLVGINRYDELRGAASAKSPAWPSRDWSNLAGTLNDVKLMHSLLEARGFQPADIRMLEDRQATRKAILDGLASLASRAKKGDLVFFYYSGHGSQVRNSRSPENDTWDESLVPADSREGAADIRDKELRNAYNRILDRGAKLTVLVDACHSGSGARGVDGELRVRFMKADERDVADGSKAPLPQERGALIIAAAKEFDVAYETQDRDGVIRGAFTWAFARALRAARPGEPVEHTFLRAQALLHADRPAQDPVLSGTAPAKSRPFLELTGSAIDRRPVLAVESRTSAGTYVVQGGWINGLTVGSELRLAGDDAIRLEVTSLIGVARAAVRVTSPSARGDELHTGALLELATWAPPPGKPLRVWIPRADDTVIAATQELRADAERRGIEWVTDPTETTPACLLRWGDRAWEIVTDGRASLVSAKALDGIAAGTALFVQVPASAEMHAAIGAAEGVELTFGPLDADYVLAGRVSSGEIEYAWIRPGVTVADARTSSLPSRTAWTASASELGIALTTLQRIHGWLDLESPPGAVAYYHLGIRRAADHTLIRDGKLLGEREHYLVLLANQSLRNVYTRFFYAFVVDSAGAGILVYPRGDDGSSGNRLPATEVASKPLRNPPAEISLDAERPFTIDEPYGIETYILLTTDEPLLSLTGLEWGGVRGPGGRPPSTPLEKLLYAALTGTRGSEPQVPAPPNWSIEKVVFESIDPRSR